MWRLGRAGDPRLGCLCFPAYFRSAATKDEQCRCPFVAMPFLLRRRGHVASEADMRRQSGLVDSPPPEPRLSESTTASTDTATADNTDDDGEPRRGSVAASLPQIREPSLEQSRSAGQPGRGSDSLSRPATPPIQEESTKHRRFSLLKFRNASDSQLSVRARQQAEAPPPLPRRMSPPGGAF